jgi:mRNA interferase HigB
MLTIVPFWDYHGTMRVISKKCLVKFWGTHKSAEQPLRAWYDEAINAKWTRSQDIKNSYRNASFIGSNRVVFNIKGNDYRLIVAVAYQFGAVYVKFIGTHAAYDGIDAKTVNMEGT